jgi:Polyketide cyclase / dehydrase and lipid transport
MASIRHEITTTATPDDVWAALQDFGAPHERLVRGFVTATETDGADRIVTFFTGTQVRERLVGIDEEHRRLAYAILDGFEHYNGSAQVHADGAGSRVTWIVDVLPEGAAERVGALMARGAEAMRDTLDAMSRVTVSHDADAGGPTGGPVAR